MVSDDGLCCGGGVRFVGEVCDSIFSSKRRRHDGKKDGETDEKKHELNRRRMSQS